MERIKVSSSSAWCVKIFTVPYATLFFSTFKQSVNPFSIKLLNDWADRYMTDALRAKVAELLDGIPDNVDALFYTANSLARHEYGCMMPWYLCRPEYELKNYEKEYKSK